MKAPPCCVLCNDQQLSTDAGAGYCIEARAKPAVSATYLALLGRNPKFPVTHNTADFLATISPHPVKESKRRLHQKTLC